MPANPKMAIEDCQKYVARLMADCGDNFPLCRALFRIYDQMPNAPCRTPCAVLFEFASKVGYEVQTTGFKIEQASQRPRAHMFQVSLALIKTGTHELIMIQHAEAIRKKEAKQLAAMKHVESFLGSIPLSLYLLLNRHDKQQMHESMKLDPEPWRVLLHRAPNNLQSMNFEGLLDNERHVSAMLMLTEGPMKAQSSPIPSKPPRPSRQSSSSTQLGTPHGSLQSSAGHHSLRMPLPPSVSASPVGSASPLHSYSSLTRFSDGTPVASPARRNNGPDLASQFHGLKLNHEHHLALIESGDVDCWATIALPPPGAQRKRCWELD